MRVCVCVCVCVCECVLTCVRACVCLERGHSSVTFAMHWGAAGYLDQRRSPLRRCMDGPTLLELPLVGGVQFPGKKVLCNT